VHAGLLSGDNAPDRFTRDGMRLVSFGKTPGRQLLAGGRPQPTAGFRAGSYASQYSGLEFHQSMQQVEWGKPYTCANGALKDGHSLDTLALCVYYGG